MSYLGYILKPYEKKKLKRISVLYIMVCKKYAEILPRFFIKIIYNFLINFLF
jgi:hypothetical protein